MLFGFACLLIANFAVEVPQDIARHLARTNETRGAFVQTKILPTGEKFVSEGTFAIRPGRDFEWRVTEPFDSLFWADREKYVYSNEDEFVEKPLSSLPFAARFDALERGDFGDFFKAFDSMYKKDGEGDEAPFHVLAKPSDARLKKVLSRVEADGTFPSWTLKATFPDGTVFSIKFDTPLTRRGEN